MKIPALLGLLLLLAMSVASAQDDIHSDNVPYIYYYSGALNGLVIERADGTDSRLLGQGLVNDRLWFTSGPGWSTDGTWFAWHKPSSDRRWPSADSGYAVHIDGQRTLSGELNGFGCIGTMVWSPISNLLLVRGKLTLQESCMSTVYPVQTYRLVDADNQRIIADFSINTDSDFGGLIGYPFIYWDDDQNVVRLREVTNWLGGDFLVSIHYDGRVEMEPISQNSALPWFQQDIPSYIDWYTGDYFTSIWLEDDANRLTIPPSSYFKGGPVASYWHPSGEWVFAGHEYCLSDCAGVVGAVSIFNPKTGVSREISDCGGHLSCLGWLPDTVDIAALPPGRSESVLPSPVSVEYNDNPSYRRGIAQTATHEIRCNLENGRLELLNNIETNAIDFVLPAAEPCGAPVQQQPEVIYRTEPVIFAMSSDGAYYAITDRVVYTALYDVMTGDHIVTLNFYGEELSFSDDSRYLITTSTSATATWDVQELIRNH